jgi:hypothetical protein
MRGSPAGSQRASLLNSRSEEDGREIAELNDFWLSFIDALGTTYFN